MAEKYKKLDEDPVEDMIAATLSSKTPMYQPASPDIKRLLMMKEDPVMIKNLPASPPKITPPFSVVRRKKTASCCSSFICFLLSIAALAAMVYLGVTAHRRYREYCQYHYGPHNYDMMRRMSPMKSDLEEPVQYSSLTFVILGNPGQSLPSFFDEDEQIMPEQSFSQLISNLLEETKLDSDSSSTGELSSSDGSSSSEESSEEKDSTPVQSISLPEFMSQIMLNRFASNDDGDLSLNMQPGNMMMMMGDPEMMQMHQQMMGDNGMMGMHNQMMGWN